MCHDFLQKFTSLEKKNSITYDVQEIFFYLSYENLISNNKQIEHVEFSFTSFFDTKRPDNIENFYKYEKYDKRTSILPRNCKNINCIFCLEENNTNNICLYNIFTIFFLIFVLVLILVMFKKKYKSKKKRM